MNQAGTQIIPDPISPLPEASRIMLQDLEEEPMSSSKDMQCEQAAPIFKGKPFIKNPGTTVFFAPRKLHSIPSQNSPTKYSLEQLYFEPAARIFCKMWSHATNFWSVNIQVNVPIRFIFRLFTRRNKASRLSHEGK